ncbi:17936_t:CDS:2 [Acaulospora morrowiae]|uniref:17936_t:CDS:1 n=1 Tax=Acaulospora morrowiae TaxID=94023 RepID=A0A9N8WRX0_9GLOM|nr:17936_t:CDS:2 [Acaulospora morrowiae]
MSSVMSRTETDNGSSSHPQALTLLSRLNSTGPIFPWSLVKLGKSNPFPRYGHSSNERAINDQIFLFGGVVGGKVQNDIKTTGDVPLARRGHTQVNIANNMIIFGGILESPRETDDCIYILNTVTKHWSKISIFEKISFGRHGHSATLVGAVMYVFGGQNERGLFFNDLFAFDATAPRSERPWKFLVPLNVLPTPRAGHSACAYKEKIYIFGGTDGVRCYNDMWCYDTQKNYWSEVFCGSITPYPRESHCASIVDDIIYIFGGRTIEGKDLADLAAFNINQKRWFMFQKMGPSPYPRYCHTMTLSQKKIFVFGGDSIQTTKPDGEGTIHILDTTKIKYPTSAFPGEMPQQRYHKRSLSEPPVSLSPKPTFTRVARQNPLFAEPQASLTNLQISVSKGNMVEDLIPSSSLMNRLQSFSRKPRTLDEYPLSKFSDKFLASSSSSIISSPSKSPDTTVSPQTMKPKILRVRPGGPKRQLKNPLLEINTIVPSVDKGKAVDRGIIELSNLDKQSSEMKNSDQLESSENKGKPNVEKSYDENPQEMTISLESHVKEQNFQRDKDDLGNTSRKQGNEFDNANGSGGQSPSLVVAKNSVPEIEKNKDDILENESSNNQKQNYVGGRGQDLNLENTDYVGRRRSRVFDSESNYYRRKSGIIDSRLIHSPNEESTESKDSLFRSSRMTPIIEDISFPNQDNIIAESSAAISAPSGIDKNIISNRGSVMFRDGSDTSSSHSDDHENYSGALQSYDREAYMERLQEQDLKIAEMKNRETWFKAKLALAKQAGFLLGLEDDGDEDVPEGIDVKNLLDIGETGSEKFKVIEAIVQLSQQLKQAKETLANKSETASQKISDFEKMYKVALEEAAALKSKFATLCSQLESEKLPSDEVQDIRSQLNQRQTQIEKSKRIAEDTETNIRMMRRAINKKDEFKSSQVSVADKFREIAERCDELEILHEIAQKELRASLSRYKGSLQKSDTDEDTDDITSEESLDIGSSNEYRVKTPSPSYSIELEQELRSAETKAEKTQLQFKQLKQKLNQVESDYQMAVKYAQNTEKLLQKVEDELTQSKKDVDNLNQKLAAVEKSNAGLEQKLFELQNLIDKHDNVRNSLLQEHTNQQMLEETTFFREREQLQQRIIELQTKISNAQDEKSLMDQGYEALRRVYESLKIQNDTLRKSNDIFKKKTLESEKMSKELEQELERTILLSKQKLPMESQEIVETSPTERYDGDQLQEIKKIEEERKMIKDQIGDFQTVNKKLAKNKVALEQRVIENENKITLLLDQMETVIGTYRIIEGEIKDLNQEDSAITLSSGIGNSESQQEKPMTPETQDDEEFSLLVPGDKDDIEDRINRVYPDLTNFVIPEYPTSPMSSTTENSEYTTFGKRDDPDYFELDKIDEEDSDELSEAENTEEKIE